MNVNKTKGETKQHLAQAKPKGRQRETQINPKHPLVKHEHFIEHVVLPSRALLENKQSDFTNCTIERNVRNSQS